MKYLMVATLRSYTSQPPDQFEWEFDDYRDAMAAHVVWTGWMDSYLWDFRAWNPGPDSHLIKPGAIVDLALRTVADRG